MRRLVCQWFSIDSRDYTLARLFVNVKMNDRKKKRHGLFEKIICKHQSDVCNKLFTIYISPDEVPRMFGTLVRWDKKEEGIYTETM